MDKKLYKRNKGSEIEIAAEQFARLFWKQWHYMKNVGDKKLLRNKFKKKI